MSKIPAAARLLVGAGLIVLAAQAGAQNATSTCDAAGIGGAARYWVYFDPEWDWRSVTPEGFLQYFRDNVDKVGPMMASDDPDLSGFRSRSDPSMPW